MERRNAWLSYEEADEKELEKLAKNYRTFLDAGKTERECVLELTREAEAAGYVSLENKLASGEQIKAGDKIYAVGMKKIMAMFHIGQEPIEKGMNILGAHIDSPRLDVKQNPLYEDTDLVYLDTHYYGGASFFFSSFSSFSGLLPIRMSRFSPSITSAAFFWSCLPAR